jgi:hypothetical protein
VVTGRVLSTDDKLATNGNLPKVVIDIERVLMGRPEDVRTGKQTMQWEPAFKMFLCGLDAQIPEWDAQPAHGPVPGGTLVVTGLQKGYLQGWCARPATRANLRRAMRAAEQERREREKEAHYAAVLRAAMLRAQAPADLETLYETANVVVVTTFSGGIDSSDERVYKEKVDRKVKDDEVQGHTNMPFVAFKLSKTAREQMGYRVELFSPVVLFLRALPPDDAEARRWGIERDPNSIIDFRRFVPVDDKFGMLMITPEVEAFLARHSG